MTGPTRELPILGLPRHRSPSRDRAEAAVEGACLLAVAVFVVSLLSYAVATAFGWRS
ncbi:hypothetical protein AB0M43_30195 [Longispora sp. NPDC051575]|uniref:hypothetical protein n=1 Tax=Longispora sp. NPDC051575 TaxID=3154943 RepID=UPI0034448CE5